MATASTVRASVRGERILPFRWTRSGEEGANASDVDSTPRSSIGSNDSSVALDEQRESWSSTSSAGERVSACSSTDCSSFASQSSTSSSSCSDDLALPLMPRVEYDAPKLLRHVMGLDQEWTSRLQIVRHYRRLEWRIVRVQADGNCLFRALSDQLYGSEIFHEDVRKRVVGYIEREARFFQPFVENEKAVETVAQYCRRMSRDGEWGGNPELFAAARLFTIELVIHQGPMRRLRITSESDVAPCRTLHLLYRDHHYDSLHDKDEGHEQSTSGSTGPTATVTSAESAQHDTPSLTDTSASDDSTTTTLMSTETKKKKKKKVVTFLGAEMQPDKAEIPQDVPVAFPKRTYFADGRAVPKSFSRRRSPGASTTAPPPSRTRSNPSSLKSDDPALQRTSSQPRILYPHRACFHNGRPMSGRTR